MFVSTAQIATDNPQRLITRLCKHWSHKFSVICDEQQGEIELNIGHCLLKALEGGLHVRLQAAEEEQIQHLQTVVRQVGGGSTRVSSHEEIIELNYGIHVAPGVTVMPNIQYTFNPDTRYTPTSAHSIDNTLVLGLQLNISFDRLFDLPHMPNNS